MSPSPLRPESADAFAAADKRYEALVSRLRGVEGRGVTHSDIEDLLWKDGMDLLRALFQAHLDERAAGEEPRPIQGADGLVRNHLRPTSRQLETRFGRVEVNRLSVGQREIGAVFPLDAELNLPAEVFSHGVQLRIAEEAARGSFADAVEAVAATTAAEVGKRQVEEVAEKAAVDFEAFYDERKPAALEDSDALVVLSVDGKGVVMRSEDLRPATQKAAASAQHKLDKRLSRGEKRNRKRMATVAAVWSVTPWVRTADDIVRGLRGAEPRAGPRPAPRDKRVWASVEREANEVIGEAFREAERRDPEHRHPWVLLVDGNPTQIKVARAQAARRRVHLTIVLDIIHVIEYLWRAAWCFHAEGDRAAEKWVSARLKHILEGKTSTVAAGIRRSATLRGLDDNARKAADAAANYMLKYKRLMRYDAFLAAGLPIATGVIEGACRYLVKDRMDITGARWSLRGAEAVLKLRALRASGDLHEYWLFHQARELARNHLPRFHPDELPKVLGATPSAPTEER
jgi:hypothetical protein